MERKLAERLPVYGVEEDCILSRRGDFTLAYRVIKPEIFTLSGADYESLHQSWVKAIRVLPPHSILHLQDWYTKVKYQAEFKGEEKSWLGNSSELFFHERPWLDHHAYLFLTKQAPPQRLENSAASSLLRPHLFPIETMDPKWVSDFLGCCGQFVRILEDGGLLQLQRLGKAELWSTRKKAGLVERYCSLDTGDTPILKDLRFGEALQIGEQHLQVFTLAEPESLPANCAPPIDYALYSTDRTKLSIGFASCIGPLLSCNHVVNQYVFTGNAPEILKKMESRRLRLQSLSAYSRENAVSEEATNAFLQEAIAEQRQPIKAHFNIVTWSDRIEDLPGIRNQVGSALAQMEATTRLETMGAAQIWWAGIPGNESDFPVNDCFDTFAEQAACFFQLESHYRSSVSPFGIRLGDRLSGIPIHVDIDDEPRARGVTANSNMVIISGSGGGKSFFTNHLVRSYYEQDTHVVIVDVGHSYELQCQLHGGYYFTYEEDHPLCFNPFYLSPGDVFDTEKKESIKTLLLALWKKSDEGHNRSEYVALSNALQLYFDRLARDGNIYPCFDSFYLFLQHDFVKVLQADQVKDKDFDVSNFLYVLRPFYKGGEFDYLLNARTNLDLLQERFIVFELDNIKGHPILFGVVTLIIMELFVAKMRKLKGVRKVIIIEEAWKAIAQQGMAEYIKYLFKTVRKFSAKAVVVTQEIEDIISSEIIKQAIINNADIKVLLDQSKFQNKFGIIQELLGITDKQKAEILSINKGHEPGRLYKDLWIGLGVSHSKVYRLEVSEEEYYVYTSDQKEKMKVKEYVKRYGSVKNGIRALLKDLRQGMGVMLIVVLSVLAPAGANAQDIVGIIKGAITTVIKALDLEVQRMQTSAIFLQEAQKTVENAMSQLDLSEIEGWVEAQKELYGDYFQELWKVKTVLSYYHKVEEILQRQEQILANYKRASALFHQDSHFSVAELAHIESVYGGILGESARNVEQLLTVINSFSTQMSDAARLAIINKTGISMDRNFDDLNRFNNENALLSLRRAGDQQEIDFLKKLYGL